jgi:hypothetical protein
MKLALIALSLLASTQAQAGFFACTSEYGVIIAGEVDSEANISGLRLIQSGDAKAADSFLQDEYASFAGKFALAARKTYDGGSIYYEIQAETANGTSPASFFVFDGSSTIRAKGFCTVGFDRSES